MQVREFHNRFNPFLEKHGIPLYNMNPTGKNPAALRATNSFPKEIRRRCASSTVFLTEIQIHKFALQAVMACLELRLDHLIFSDLN